MQMANGLRTLIAADSHITGFEVVHPLVVQLALSEEDKETGEKNTSLTRGQ